MRLVVNGKPHDVTVDAERTLLSVLREELGLTGTKYGCGEGNCGSCTVLLGGDATRSCITPVVSASGREVITIEGLAEGDTLHPVQAAFIQETAFQCAYCTPGFIIGSVALLSRNPLPSDDEIRSGLSGHICRCWAYTRILRGVRAAARKSTNGQNGAI